MTFEERANVVLAFARVLFVNGQATEQTVAAAERLAHALGLRAELIPRWGQLQLQSADKDARLISQVAADPAGVNMERVASAMRTIAKLEAGQVAPEQATRAIEAIELAPPVPTWLFALAAAFGAVALSVIFGLEHSLPALLIFVSAGCGAILRRVRCGTARISSSATLPATGWHHRRARASLRVKFIAAPRRGLPVHGARCPVLTFSTAHWT